MLAKMSMFVAEIFSKGISIQFLRHSQILTNWYAMLFHPTSNGNGKHFK